VDPVVVRGADIDTVVCHASCLAERKNPDSERQITSTSSPPFQPGHERPAPTDLLAAIVASSDDAIISKTLHGIITSWNAGAERLFGYTAKEAIGQSILMIIPDDRKAEEDMILGRLRRGERIEHFETLRRAKNGRLIDISLSISPIRNENGQLVGASKVARDITEQKRTQRELLEADIRKNEFLALLAHELRNPLGPIRHAVKILRARQPSAEELQWATSIIDRQTEHMTRLVDDLLDVSRITRGTIELRHDRVDVAAILRAAVEASGAAIERSRHELRASPPPEPMYVDGDATRLTQIVTNLLDNAAKYTDPGGEIWLSAERDGNEAVIRVKDSGIGISADMLPKIFDMFTQAGMSLDRAQGGLGVGLSLVERLVKLHGGTVTAYSAGPGKGSQFTVRLPTVAAHDTVPELRAEHARIEPGNRCRVLVVDDNIDSADSLAMLLRMLGHEVQIANEAAEALRLLDEFRPQVAILDIGLPKVSGYELGRQIRERPWASDVVLVALTGWGQEQHRRRSAESGFDHHLTKPVEFDVLQQILAEADRSLPDSKAAAR
jgi:PAS domain S-box-containing protein